LEVSGIWAGIHVERGVYEVPNGRTFMNLGARLNAVSGIRRCTYEVHVLIPSPEQLSYFRCKMVFMEHLIPPGNRPIFGGKITYF